MNDKKDKGFINLIKENWTSLVAIIVITGIVAFLINLLIITKMPFNIPVSEDNAWIGFWGSVSGALIAGLISVYIFYLTIQYNQKQINDQRSMEIAPYLRYYVTDGVAEDTPTIYLFTEGIKVEDCKLFLKKKYKGNLDFEELTRDWDDSDFINTYRQMYMKANQKYYYKYFTLNMENLGLNHATDVNIKKIKFCCDEFNYSDNLTLSTNSKINNDYGIDVLKVDSSLSIGLALIFNKNLNEDSEVNIVVEYRDLSMNLYKQMLSVDCTYEENEHRIYLHRKNIEKSIKLNI